jgi:hypothetical protein
MLDEIVLDCEIQDPITKNEDWDRTDLMKISCCVVYSYVADSYQVYGPNDIDHLRQMLVMSDRIIGYNINKFDIPIIFGVPRDRGYTFKLKTYDILAEIWKAQGLDPTEFSDAHKGWSLDTVCGATILQRKSGHGANAPFLYKQGDIWRVISYCINDVKLTRDLYNHIKTQKYVMNRFGNTVKMEA